MAMGAAMLSSAIAAAFEHTKNLAATLGAGGVVVSVYVSAGMPLPATQAFVEAKVSTVVARIDASDATSAKKIDALNASTLELQRKSIVQQKARLRFEAQANASIVSKADPARRATLERRAAEIGDELGELDREDEGLRGRIEKLRQPGG